MPEATAIPVTGPSAAKRRRQRSPSPPAPRKKSCEACRRAKARCNEATPSCSRCERKGVPCNYDGTRNEDAAVPPPDADTHLATLISQGLTGAGSFSGALIDALTNTDALAVAENRAVVDQSQFLGSEARFVSAESPEGEGPSSSESSDGTGSGYQTSITSIQSSESPDSLNVDPVLMEEHQQRVANWDPSLLPFTMRSHYREDGTKELEIVPNDELEDFNPRFLGFNVTWPSDCALSAHRVIGSFKLWPKLMVKAEQLPPFIHPHFPSLHVSQSTALTAALPGRPRQGFAPKLPEALANCSSVCTMFFNKTPENTGFVWKSIKREQERIYANYRDWAPQDVISSFQAMLMYAFLRMIDGENEHNDFDMAFVLTVSELGTALWSDRLRALQSRKQEANQVNWADWMLAESVCRTGMVFQFMFIMLQLYKALPPTPGCRGIDDIPLPCGRRLWQTKTYSEWRSEYAAYQASRKSSRILKFGDLKVMRNDTVNRLTLQEQEDLATWASDLDEFGNLVLIAGLSGPGSLLDDYRKTHVQVFT